MSYKRWFAGILARYSLVQERVVRFESVLRTCCGGWFDAPCLDVWGEKEGTDFDYLVDRVWGLSDDWPRVILTGILLCVLSVGGIALEIVQKRKEGIIEAARRQRIQ